MNRENGNVGAMVYGVLHNMNKNVRLVRTWQTGSAQVLPRRVVGRPGWP
jgi:homoserine acetyltransferase